MTQDEKLHKVKSLVEEGGMFLHRHVPLDKRHFIVKFTKEENSKSDLYEFYWGVLAMMEEEARQVAETDPEDKEAQHLARAMKKCLSMVEEEMTEGAKEGVR